ncbi:LOW QUALITY PROTEIN: ras association domain-containing protein 7-like [Osmerus eperlanus]|uniref:LOW QUALITY PROTEIN: ras association domain-containing protein 7-like n=1 Tax=Osmerus eperlanus TaxID=29151 RepID=UPI002E0F4D57
MELKVWVEGVARVVGGLSLDTSCQEVVIALAQAIGQKGRYVLLQKLRGCERRLVADDCPLRSLAQVGTLAKEVQFILRRTGPSLGDESPGWAPSLLPLHPDPEPPTRWEPRKALSFHLGPSTIPRRTRAQTGAPRGSPELRASTPPPSHAPSPSSHAPSPPSPAPSPHSPAPSPSSHAPPSPLSKEDIFSQALKQQETLRDIEAQLRGLEREEETWERPLTPAPGLARGLQEERLNQAEVILEEQLQVEMEREQDLLRRLKHLCSCLEDCSGRVLELQASAEDQGRDLQHEAQRQGSRLGRARPTAPLDTLRLELHLRQVQGEELKAMMMEAERETQAVEEQMQEKRQEMEELNKDFRQCNLQQFIQQTGNSPALDHTHTPDHPHTPLPDHTHPSQPLHTSPLPPDQTHPAPISTPHPGHAPIPYLCSAGMLDEDQSDSVIVC